MPVRTSLPVRRFVSCNCIAVAFCFAVLVATGSLDAQTAHFIGAEITVGSGFYEPFGLAIDSQGNLYVGDSSTHTISEVFAVNGVIPASPTIRTLISGWTTVDEPWNLTVSSNGDLYIADFYEGFIEKIVAVNGSIPPSPSVVTLATGLGHPAGLALDGKGNIYFSDYYNNVVQEIVAVNGSIPPSPTVITLASGFTNPEGLALDAAGDLYVADSNAGALKVVVAVNGIIPAVPTVNTVVSGFGSPNGVTLDAGGNLYFSDRNENAVFEIVAVNGSIPAAPTINKLGSISAPASIALSPNGGVYVGGVFTSIPELSPFGSDFGSVPIGVQRHAIPYTFQFDSGGTLGSTVVLTQGTVGLDFADAGADSCTANTTYSAGQTCTINISFTPLFSGSRNGAVQLNDSNGNVIATTYLQGTGVGPQLTFSPVTQTTLGSSFDFAAGVAVDGSGNAYVVDVINNLGNVEEVMAVNGRIPANPTIRRLVGNIDCPIGPAIDAAGNVYFADACYHTVNEILAVNGQIPASPTTRVLTSHIASPAGIAVDSAGNVYVLDAGNKTVDELPAENGTVSNPTTILTLAGGFEEVDGIAVDGNGNVYVSDDTSREVFEIHAVNGSIPTSPLITPLGSGFVIPRGVAVDVAGNVYVAEYFYNTVYKLLAVNGIIPASPTIQNIGTGLVYANGVAVDANRNVFVADYGDARVVRLDYADPPSLSFSSTVIGSTSVDSPHTVTLENVGNADLILPIPTSGNNPSVSSNFALDDNAPSACPVISSGSLTVGVVSAGNSCMLPISFAPNATGSLSGSLQLTDNNLNAAGPGYAIQPISLSGTATSNTPTITWATPGVIAYGTALTDTQLNATASTPGTFAYSPAAGTVLTAGVHTLNVTFTPTDTTDYTTATSSVQLTVNKATPVITWPTPAPVAYGTALSSIQLDATANVPGTFAYSPVTGTILSTGTNTLNVIFTPNDTADYTTANASVSLVVNPPPSFGLTASPSSLTAKQGAQASSTISVSALYGFTGAVSLSLSSLPKGVTATFSPNPATKTSTVTFSLSSSVSPASSLVTITGKSGSLTQTTTITLTAVKK